MLRGFRKRLVVAVIASGLPWVAMVGVGCGSEEDAGSVGSPAEEDGVLSTDSELRRRARRWRTTARTTNTPKTDAASTTTSTTPNTGVVDSSNSGGTCPNNRAMPAGGACGPYGVNCTYDDGSGSHYCLCLNSGPTGVQGWSCL
jgi:hypothetical protein